MFGFQVVAEEREWVDFGEAGEGVEFFVVFGYAEWDVWWGGEHVGDGVYGGVL